MLSRPYTDTRPLPLSANAAPASSSRPSVPIAAVPDFIEEANAAVVKLIPGARPVPFGHLGDGNIHYNVSQPVGANAADFLARWHDVNAVVFEIVLRMGGSISAEHGIGQLKREELLRYKSPVEMALMRSLRMAGRALGDTANLQGKRKIERDSRKLREELEGDELLAS